MGLTTAPYGALFPGLMGWPPQGFQFDDQIDMSRPSPNGGLIGGGPILPGPGGLGGEAAAQANGLGGQFPPAPPAPMPQSGGGFLGGMFSPENSDVMGAIGLGMMNGNFANALAGGLQARQANKLQKATKFLLMRRGLPEDEAEAASQNPALINAALKSNSRNLINVGGGQLYDADTGQWITAPGATEQDEFSKREAAALRYGLKKGDPAYQTFMLTGKMPREDQAPLTSTDKKAILEADDMVSANENAINALDQAEKISDNANSGWFAGARASVGNNLPDMMVPDWVSSPQSSQATADMDNAVVGQALTSLRTIFGGNPTEGERKILLDLQGSSSMPKAVRKQVFARAKELAKRRLEFNKQRAAQLRGGSYYKQGGMSDTIPPPADSGGGYKVLSVE